MTHVPHKTHTHNKCNTPAAAATTERIEFRTWAAGGNFIGILLNKTTL